MEDEFLLNRMQFFSLCSLTLNYERHLLPVYIALIDSIIKACSKLNILGRALLFFILNHLKNLHFVQVGRLSNIFYKKVFEYEKVDFS